jgi:hypothetical protein
MTGATLAARLRPAVGALGRATDRITQHVVVALGCIVAVQIALTAVLFLSVEHNGWLTYQGGDQLWLVTTGWLIGQGLLPYALVGYGWPVLLAPLTWLTGASSLDLLPYTTVLQVAVLGPIATLAVYDIGARIAGRAAGLWCASLWVLTPFLVIPLFEDRYQERFTDQVLVQALGLTQLADYPSMVLVVVAAALVLRSLDAGAIREAALAGAVTAFAIGMKPANALFLTGAAAAYVLARRWRGALVFAAMLVPAAILLAVWKARGTGSVPAFGMDAAHVAASWRPQLPLAESFWERFPLHLEDWERNMSNLREFFWSARLAQWAPLAGALAVARRSVPAAGLLLGWVLAYVVVKGSSPVSSLEAGSFWRLVMPSFPAYVLLLAAIPLLVPTLPRRLGPRIAALPGRRPGRRVVAAAVVLLAVVPAAFVLAATPLRGAEKAILVEGILVPVDGDTVQLSTTRVGTAQHLTWEDSTSPTRPFYKVYRTEGDDSDVNCIPKGADRCGLNMIVLATTRGHSYVDRSPEPGVTYRIGVAANWVDDTEQGDVMLISPPVRAAA